MSTDAFHSAQHLHTMDSAALCVAVGETAIHVESCDSLYDTVLCVGLCNIQRCFTSGHQLGSLAIKLKRENVW